MKCLQNHFFYVKKIIFYFSRFYPLLNLAGLNQTQAMFWSIDISMFTLITKFRIVLLKVLIGPSGYINGLTETINKKL